ncbi:hypothetical protein GCM10027569_71930 [Flindersiella endophytica]
MACGNPDISRDALGSQPAHLNHPKPGQSFWTPARPEPPEVGVILGHKGVFSFKVGVPGGPRDGHTLIADGDFSDDPEGFNADHNHYGPDAGRPGEFFNEDRGYYTGPDH